MDTESGVVVRRRRNREEVEQLVIGYRSSQVPRKEYCRLHGIGLSTLDRYLQSSGTGNGVKGEKMLQRKADWWPWSWPGLHRFPPAAAGQFPSGR